MVSLIIVWIAGGISIPLTWMLIRNFDVVAVSRLTIVAVCAVLSMLITGTFVATRGWPTGFLGAAPVAMLAMFGLIAASAVRLRFARVISETARKQLAANPEVNSRFQ